MRDFGTLSSSFWYFQFEKLVLSVREIGTLGFCAIPCGYWDEWHFQNRVDSVESVESVSATAAPF